MPPVPSRRALCAALLAAVSLAPMVVRVDAQRTPSTYGRRFALLVGTDTYTAGREWSNLSSPVRDASTIARTLASEFGFDTTVVRNATQGQVVQALLDLKRRATAPNDWVVVFIASHGFFDEDRSQGYLVFRDSRPRANDVALGSYMALTVLLPMLEGFSAGHVLLVIDACYAGTIDRDIRTGTDRGATERSTSLRDVESAVRRRSQYRSRIFLTSGGKEYVPDGGPGGHSPFAGALLAALREASNDALPLSFSQLLGELDRAAVQPLPRHGTFNGHEPGGDFIFIPSSFTTALASGESRSIAPRDAVVAGGEGRGPPRVNTDPPPRQPAGTNVATVPRAAPAKAATISEAATLLTSGAERGVDALSTACNSGDASSCLAAGRRVLLAHGATRDESRARTLLERGCTLGDTAACAERYLLDARDTDPRRANDGQGKLRQACDADDPYACAALVRLWLRAGTGGSPGELLGVLRPACEGLVPAACVYAALATPRPAGQVIAPAGETLLQVGCRGLDATACAFLARLYVERDRSRSERDLAARLSEAACAVYNPVGCNLLAEQYVYGIGVDVDYARARGYAERSCRGRSGEGCYLLGRMSELGLGSARDTRAANQLYADACRAGVRTDCSRSLTPRSEIDWWRAVP